MERENLAVERDLYSYKQGSMWLQKGVCIIIERGLYGHEKGSVVL